MRLKSKIALLTGAAAAIKGELMGFGGAAAHLFVREGAKVILTDIRDDLGERAAAALRAAIPAMRKGGGGSIINTSSVMGIVGSPTSPAYSAAKGAITTFTKSAALQYAKENIRINSVHPGYADTPLTDRRFNDPTIRQQLLDRTPMGRLGTAMDIANGVLFLASDESSWVTGSELVIDGGMTAQ